MAVILQRYSIILLLVSFYLGLSSCGLNHTSESDLNEAPTGDNSPHWFGMESRVYNDMPLQGKLSKMPWPDHYWATYQGGISYRWQTDAVQSRDYKEFIYDIPSPTDTAAMTESQLNQLSPSEKFDILRGVAPDSSSSASQWQRRKMLAVASYNQDMFQRDEIPHWAGICNGWSLAAISTPEPDHSVTLDLTDGRRITFYVADIKALLSQLYNDFQESTPVKRIGSRCSEANVKMEDGRIIDPDCRDVNPMSFHLALNDYLAKDKAFVIDVEPSEQVWNQPAYGYSMSITPAQAVSTAHPHHAPGTVYTSKVQVNFQYIVESGPVRDKIIGTDFASQMIRSKLYAYTLELDENKKVIGGEWAAGTQGPDFMWVTDKTPSQESFRANYPLDVKTINHLLEQSLN